MSSGKGPQLAKGSIVLTKDELILKAETIQAVKVVDSNYSFASTKGDAERFRFMFPDSDIAKNRS